MNLDYDVVVYLDTDVRIVGDLNPIFEEGPSGKEREDTVTTEKYRCIYIVYSYISVCIAIQEVTWGAGSH